jgi:hypothetical protein
MAVSDQCPICKNDIPRTEARCPHCAQPSRFPNVLDASEDAERLALDQRYRAAIRDSDARGCGAVIRQFEAEAATSRAVMARSVTDLDRLATSDRQLYATYYNLIRAGVRVSTGEKWDRLRVVTDEALFGENKGEIRFAALTLDGIGLDNYGECSLVARSDMIAHRASLIEENSVKFMERHKIEIAGVNDLPKGYRAPWEDRSKLCTAKLAAAIDPTSRPEDFAKLLLNPGKTSDDDQFVEVHIWGPMSVRTFEQVIVRRKKSEPRMKTLKALEGRLKRYTIPLQVM